MMINGCEQIHVSMSANIPTRALKDILLNCRMTNCLDFSTENHVSQYTLQSQPKWIGWSPYYCQIENSMEFKQ